MGVFLFLVGFGLLFTGLQGIIIGIILMGLGGFILKNSKKIYKEVDVDTSADTSVDAKVDDKISS